MSSNAIVRVLLEYLDEKHKLNVPKPPQPTTVFFSHLNPSVTDEQLKSACAAYGRVLSAYCVNSAQNGCRQGYTTYASHQEACQAANQAIIEFIPARVIGSNNQMPVVLKIGDLKHYLRSSRPDLIGGLNEDLYYFQILDNDFQVYVRLEPNAPIGDMARIRVQSTNTNVFHGVGSSGHRGTSQVVEPDLISAIGSGRPRSQLPSSTSGGSSLSNQFVTDFSFDSWAPLDHKPPTEGIDAIRSASSCSTLTPRPSKSPTWAQIANAGNSKSPSPNSTPDPTGNLAFERALLAELVKYLSDLKSTDAQRLDMLWFTIAANLVDAGFGQKLSSEFCRQQFEKLSREYTETKKSNNGSISKWPLLSMFRDIFEPFLGFEWLCDLVTSKDCSSRTSSLVKPLPSSSGRASGDAIDVSALKQLVSAVNRNSDMILNSSVSEYEFWQKISYELTRYMSPIELETWRVWRSQFYDGLTYFLDLEDDALILGTTAWPLFHEFASMSVVLIDELKMRKNILDSNSQSPKGDSADSSFKLVSHTKTRPRHQVRDSIDIPRKIQLVRLMSSRLKVLADPLSPEWSDIKNQMVATGYLPPGSKIDLRSYFISMVRNYIEAMAVASSNSEANKICPYFHAMKKVDLGAFLPKTGPCPDKSSYLKMKAKFQK